MTLPGIVAACLALVLGIMLAVPASAFAMTTNKATARPNEDGGDSVIGGIATRLTWEGTVGDDEQVSSITLEIPDGGSFDDAVIDVTVLDGLNRIEVESESETDGNVLTVTFTEPIASGSLLRIEAEGMSFSPDGGDQVVSGSYVDGEGNEHELDDSSPISTIVLTPLQQAVYWLDENPAVQAWNSVPFLGMFLKPQLLLTSLVSLFPGWLLCLAIVVIAYPFAILLGLLFAMMKISRHKVLRAIAVVYINLLRGTPLFLQIYIAFFGLPLMGIDPNKYLLAILVLAFNSGAYMCEILRAGIQSIHRGQFEAARSLGMTQAQTMFSVIIPQTVRRVIPTMTSEFILLYKDTSLLAAVGVMELMLYARSVVANTGNMTPYLVAAVFYLIVTLPLIHVVTKLERRMAESDDGGSSPRKTRRNRRGALRQMAEEMGEIGNQEAPGPSGANAAAGAAQKEA